MLNAFEHYQQFSSNFSNLNGNGISIVTDQYIGRMPDLALHTQKGFPRRSTNYYASLEEHSDRHKCCDV